MNSLTSSTPARLGVDVHLEEIPLARRVDAHRHRVASKGALEHGLGQVDERQPPEEVGALEQVQLRRLVRRERLVGQAAVVVEGRGAVAVQPSSINLGPDHGFSQGMPSSICRLSGSRSGIDVEAAVAQLRPGDAFDPFLRMVDQAEVLGHFTEEIGHHGAQRHAGLLHGVLSSDSAPQHRIAPAGEQGGERGIRLLARRCRIELLQVGELLDVPLPLVEDALSQLLLADEQRDLPEDLADPERLCRPGLPSERKSASICLKKSRSSGRRRRIAAISAAFPVILRISPVVCLPGAGSARRPRGPVPGRAVAIHGVGEEHLEAAAGTG